MWRLLGFVLGLELACASSPTPPAESEPSRPPSATRTLAQPTAEPSVEAPVSATTDPPVSTPSSNEDPAQPVGRGGVGLGGTGRGGGGQGEGSISRDTTLWAPLDIKIRTGKLDRNSIRAVVRAHKGAVRGCFERGGVSPELGARVVVKFRVVPSGAVSTSAVENTTAPDAVAACVAGAVATWRFPNSEKVTTDVSYPFVFSSEPTPQ